MSITGIIPARYGSSRFPGKPLAMIQDKPMIQWVYERAKKASTLDQVIVATDDERIFERVKAFGGDVVMTAIHHTNGTERCAEVVRNLKQRPDYVINIQGDEPLIDPDQIDVLGQLLQTEQPRIATLIKQMDSADEINNPNVVKAVRSSTGQALYFSRHAIPYQRSTDNGVPTYYKHIGIYGFSAAALLEVVALKPSSLELAESLEQLRWLEHGEAVFTAITHQENYAVDSPEDIQTILNVLSHGET